MNPSSPWTRTAERTCDGLAVMVLIVVALAGLATFKDYGLGWDDYTHAEYGALLLRAFESGFTDQRALSFVNLYAYGGGFDMMAARVAQLLPFDLFETRRLCGAAVGLIGLAATWRTARHLAGPLGGLIALLLLATCPLYYGHMFMNPKDAPFAVAVAVLMLGVVRVFMEYPAPSAPTVAIVGTGLGLAIGTRILGGIDVTAAILGLLFVVAAETRARGLPQAGGRLGRFMLALIPAGVLAYAVMALEWPWGVADPFNPFRAVAYFSHFFEKPWKELFAGDLLPVPDMPRSYVPQLLALQLPEIFLLLGVAGVVGALVVATRRSVALERRAALLVMALSAALPVVLTVAMRPAMYNGIRHFVFVTPPLAIVAGWAGANVLAWLRARSNAGWMAAALCGIGALAPPVIDMVRLHPYEYTYFNWIAGGVQAAQQRYMLDYWGLAFKQAAAALHATLAQRSEAPPAGRHWRVAACGPQRPAQVELGPQFDVSWEPKGADWAMTLGTFYCAALKAPVIAEVEREGVVYALVYDLRGKTVDTLLSVPAP